MGGLEVWVVARQGVARHGVRGLLHAMEVYVANTAWAEERRVAKGKSNHNLSSLSTNKNRQTNAAWVGRRVAA